MKNININPAVLTPRHSLLAAAIGLALVTGPVAAVDLSVGELSINLDTTVSYATGVRVADRDDDLVAKSHFNPFVSALPIEQQIAAPGRFSANSDDGNLNFDSGDPVFNQFRITSEVDIRYRRIGAFVRGNYFKDFTLDNKDAIPRRAKDFVGQRARLLDAYVYGDFDVGDRFVQVRIGRQVVSWGESTFLPGGLSVINPVDVSALRTAGAELRDAFQPLGMAWASIGLTRNLSAELMVGFEWDRVEPEPSGTFFSTNDFAARGGQFAMLGFGLFPDTPLSAPGCNIDPLPMACFPAGNLPRVPNDEKADDLGQFGIALRYFAPSLNDTEFGLFWLRYHSKLPLLNGVAVTSADTSTGRVQVVFPEDIDTIAASFNTTVGTWAWQGEISYRPNLPLQIDDVELLFAGLSPLNAVLPQPALHFRSQLGNFAPGEEIQGFLEREVSQIQTTLTKLYGPNNFLQADQVAVVGEVGATHVWDLPDRSELRFEGPGTDTSGSVGNQLNGGDLRNPITTRDGFATAFSWGYRVAVVPTYNSVIGSWNMTLPVAFNHDVTGTSPGPGGNFIEGRKSITLGLGFDYQSRWRLNFSYTNFFGAGTNNLLKDRDFVSGVLSYSF